MEMKYIRALQIWAVLTYAASKSQTMTYEELSNVTGVHNWGASVSNPLGVLKRYCESKGLFPLTALVVSKRTGIPQNWNEEEMGYWHERVQRVFRYKWKNEKVPTLKNLARVDKP